ncbi:hypothetical protein [Leptospira sp. 'Mane']|uniref:hypothetical protein n=1 Tax=Leptospira sp. 'Mane' TaxID=3387407 RepID=UPI00398AA939
MKKSLIKLGICVALIAVLVVNCKKKEDDDNTPMAFLLLYINDQMSGNCATITKATASGVVTYTAVANAVPKGGCNESTLATYTTSSASAKAISDTDFDAKTPIFAKYSECSTLAATQAVSKANVTTASLETSANNAANGCTSVGNSNAGQTYCKDAAALAALKATIQYQSISDAKADMSTNYTGSQVANSTTSVGASYGYTTAALLALRLATTTELTMLSKGAEFNAVYAGLGTSASCQAKIINDSAALKTLVTKNVAVTSALVTGGAIGSADRAAVSETIISSLTCKYGAGFTAATATVGTTAAIGVCPSSYPSF